MNHSNKIALLLLLFIALLRSGLTAERLVPSQYPTIQQAIDAASTGDTVRIAAGEYRDQAVVRNKKISITGDTGATFHAHSDMTNVGTQAFAIFAFERAEVMVSNLIFDGQRLGEQYPFNRFWGIIFRSASGSLENCVLRGFRGVFGDNAARAVVVNNEFQQGIINVSVQGCSFSDNYDSLTFLGNDSTASLLTRFIVRSNNFTGLGPGAPFAHHGLAVSVGAEGSVIGNTFTGHIYNEFLNHGAGASNNDGLFDQRGRFLPLRPVVYSGNVFSNNTVHFLGVMANDFKITNNVFAATAPDSSEAALWLSGRNVVIADNNFAGGAEAIRLFGRDDMAFDVPLGIATNTKISGNWFTNFASLIHTNPLVTFEQTGTETCCFTPKFQTLDVSDDGKTRLQVRAWHDTPLILESSPDLKQWIAVRTNTPALPISEFESQNSAQNGHEFFRIRRRP